MNTIYNNYIIEIKKNIFSKQPKEKKLGIMVCGIYNGKQIGETNEYNSFKNFDIDKSKKKVIKNNDIAVIIDLFVKMRNDNPFVGFNQKDDKIGFIFTTKEKIKQKYGIKNVCDLDILHAEEELENQIKEYNTSLNHFNYNCVIYKEGERRLAKFESFSENEAIEYAKQLIDNGGHIN